MQFMTAIFNTLVLRNPSPLTLSQSHILVPDQYSTWWPTTNWSFKSPGPSGSVEGRTPGLWRYGAWVTLPKIVSWPLSAVVILRITSYGVPTDADGTVQSGYVDPWSWKSFFLVIWLSIINHRLIVNKLKLTTYWLKNGSKIVIFNFIRPCEKISRCSYFPRQDVQSTTPYSALTIP